MYIYKLLSENNELLYIGITNNIKRRIYQHSTEKEFAYCTYSEVAEDISSSLESYMIGKYKPPLNKASLPQGNVVVNTMLDKAEQSLVWLVKGRRFVCEYDYILSTTKDLSIPKTILAARYIENTLTQEILKTTPMMINLYSFLLNEYNDCVEQGRLCFPSQMVISSCIGATRQHINPAMRELEKIGAVVNIKGTISSLQGNKSCYIVEDVTKSPFIIHRDNPDVKQFANRKRQLEDDYKKYSERKILQEGV